MTPAGRRDALLDAVALVRALYTADDEAAAIVAANLASPELTASCLAEWVAGLMRATGTGLDEIAAWQARLPQGGTP